MNAEWHRAHVMPKNPTEEQRVQWHVEHAIACSCRALPETIREEVLRRIAAKGEKPLRGDKA